MAANVPPLPIAPQQPQPPVLPPFVVPPLAPAVGPRTYLEIYSDAANDPWGGVYRDIMSQFTTVAANTPETLTTRMLAYGPTTPQAYVMLAAGTDPGVVGRIVLMHRPTKHSVSVPPTQWDETVMAFEGDVLGQSCTAVEWPPTAFRQVSNGAALQVPTLVNLDALFDADPLLQTVGPFAANEVGTELIRTRSVMFLPPRYIAIVLGQNLTPRDAYLRLGGAIRADGLELDCAPLLSFLRAACTLPTGQPVPALQRAAATVLRADAALYRHIRDNVVLRDLPGLQQPETLEPSLHVARAIGELVVEHRATRADAAARRLEDVATTPAGKWGHALEMGLRLTQSATADDLPPVWHDLAAASKRFEGTTIDRAIAAMVLTLGISPDTAPYVTPSLTSKIVSFAFGHPDCEDLEQGIHPFTVGYRTQAESNLARQQSRQHALLLDGAAPRLTDLVTLQSSDKVRLPSTCLQVSIPLDNYRVLLQTFFGPIHRLTYEFDRFTATWKAKSAQFEQQMGEYPLTPIYVVRWVQLRLNVWFQNQARTNDATDAPDLQELFRKFDLQDSWHPRVPAAYLLRPLATPAPAPTLPRPVLPAPSGGPPAVPLPGGRGPPAVPQPRGDRATNTNYLPAFLPWKTVPGQLRTYLRPPGGTEVQPPRNDAGAEMCITWHIRGHCNTLCGRCADHKTPSAPEITRLVAWCHSHFPAIA